MTDSNKGEKNTYKYALEYIEKGYSPIPIPLGEKAPKLKGWPTIRLNQENYSKYFNGNKLNIGIILGDASGGLVDIDLDCAEAIKLAPYFLPPTQSIFGRQSKPRSHYLYICNEIKKTKKFEYESLGSIVEVRSNKSQTVFPPSIHPSGEEVKWSGNQEPAKIQKEPLLRAVSQLAAACILTKYWPEEGMRNDTALALSGTLCHAGWPQEETERYIEAVTQVAGDEESKSRVKVVENTYEKHKKGEPLLGLPKLKELMGEKRINTISKWLEFKSNKKRFGTTSDNSIEITENNIIKWEETENGPAFKELATFSIIPLESIYLPGKGESLKVILKSKKGSEREIILPPEAWELKKNFLKLLPDKEFVWYGNATNDLQRLRYRLSDFEFSHFIGEKTAGIHDGVFITENGTVGKNESGNNLIYWNEFKTGCELPFIKSASTKELENINKYIRTFNKPDVVSSVLGWAVACFFKQRIQKLFGHFPILSLEGEAGSGKTSTIETIIMNIWCLRGNPKAISEQSKFSFMKMVDSSNCIPIILEENKTSRLNNTQKAQISNLIRETYNELEGNRGRPDQTLKVYNYQAPVCIAGEAGFMEPALLDRVVPVHLSKKESGPYEVKI